MKKNQQKQDPQLQKILRQLFDYRDDLRWALAHAQSSQEVQVLGDQIGAVQAAIDFLKQI